MDHGCRIYTEPIESTITLTNTKNMKHIPTLQIIFYKEENDYAYRYDDQYGNTQEEGMYPNLKDCIFAAMMHLKTFTLLEDIEEL